MIILRTIRRGQVKFHGRWFAVDEQYQAYDGRLDGMRYAFGVYPTRDGFEPLLSLWGTEAQYLNAEAPNGPEAIEGTLPWSWWHMVAQRDVRERQEREAPL